MKAHLYSSDFICLVKAIKVSQLNIFGKTVSQLKINNLRAGPPLCSHQSQVGYGIEPPPMSRMHKQVNLEEDGPLAILVP